MTEPHQLETLAARAVDLTTQYFGKTISIYAPLYLSNYCDNECVYCGFNCKADIPRMQLSEKEIEQECQRLQRVGIQSVLLLTGESRSSTPPEYIESAVRIATRYFPHVALEIYPLETSEYACLFQAGADGVTLYQETYDRDRYAQLHRRGKKRNYDYRYEAPKRLSSVGFHHVSLGVLLGLADWKRDVIALYEHLRYLEHHYPGVEFNLSFPRLQRLTDAEFETFHVSDLEMVKILCVTRILFSRTGINLSTREDPHFRNHILGLGVTRISAGSSTKVGGYATHRDESSPGQFPINDERTVPEIVSLIKSKGFDPIFTDWRHFSNA